MASRLVPATDRTVSIGRIFSRAFSAIGAMPGTIAGIVMLFGAIPAVALAYAQQSILASLPDSPVALGPLLGTLVLSLLGGIVLAYVAQGVLAPAVVAHADGGRMGFADCVAGALPTIFSLIAVAIVVALGFIIGLALLIVPGMIVYLIWSVAAEVTVVERLGIMAALKRSRYLTSGARWKIFGLFLIESVFVWLLIAAIHIVTRAFGQNDTLAGAVSPVSFAVWLITNFAQTTILGVVMHTAQASLYVELRDWKDGTSSERLAGVFA